MQTTLHKIDEQRDLAHGVMTLTLFLPQTSPRPQIAEFIKTQERVRDIQTENMLKKSGYLMSRGQKEL